MCTNSFHRLSFTKLHANAIEAFHRTLGGRMFRHEKMGNGDNVPCPFISKSKIGLWPFPITPQFNKSNMNSSMNCFTKFSKQRQFRAPKYINGEPKNQGTMHLLVGMNKNMKRKEKTQQWSLGAARTKLFRSCCIF